MSYSSVTVSGYNASPPSDDGSTDSSNRITWAGIKSKLGDPLKTAIESINTNVGTAIAANEASIATNTANIATNAADIAALESATAAAALLTAIKTVDGSGSGLDADLLDGNSSAAFCQVANNLSDVTAATAFGNIKQAATTSATGVVELATTTETKARSSSSVAVTPDGLSDFARIKTGSYTGDGAESQSITGVGFQPKYVIITPRSTSAVGIEEYWTTDVIIDDNAAGMAVQDKSDETALVLNAIIAFGADGFTVDDNSSDSHPNTNGVTYNYIAFG